MRRRRKLAAGHSFSMLQIRSAERIRIAPVPIPLLNLQRPLRILVPHPRRQINPFAFLPQRLPQHLPLRLPFTQKLPHVARAPTDHIVLPARDPQRLEHVHHAAAPQRDAVVVFDPGAAVLGPDGFERVPGFDVFEVLGRDGLPGLEGVKVFAGDFEGALEGVFGLDFVLEGVKGKRCSVGTARRA